MEQLTIYDIARSMSIMDGMELLGYKDVGKYIKEVLDTKKHIKNTM